MTAWIGLVLEAVVSAEVVVLNGGHVPVMSRGWA